MPSALPPRPASPQRLPQLFPFCPLHTEQRTQASHQVSQPSRLSFLSMGHAGQNEIHVGGCTMCKTKCGLLTAQRCNRRVDRLDQHAVMVQLSEQTHPLASSVLPGCKKMHICGSPLDALHPGPRKEKTHLLQSLGIHQNPANLNDLGRVLCHIDSVLVACRGYVDDHVPVNVVGDRRRGGLLCRLRLARCHDCCGSAGCSMKGMTIARRLGYGRDGVETEQGRSVDD